MVGGSGRNPEGNWTLSAGQIVKTGEKKPRKTATDFFFLPSSPSLDLKKEKKKLKTSSRRVKKSSFLPKA